MSTSKLRFALPLLAAGLAAACGGSDNDPDSVFLPGSSNVGGIWTGTVTTAGVAENIYGIVSEDGSFRFISDAGVQYVGEITGDGTPFAGTYAGVTDLGTEYCAGVTTSEGQILSGSVNKGSRLGGETLSSINCPSQVPFRSNFDLTYNSQYERDATFSAVAGEYVDSGTGDSVTVYNTGAIFSQGSVSGCLATGSIAPVDTRFNVYTIAIQYACTGPDPRDGLSFEGLATLDADQLIAGVSTTTEGLVLVLDRN